MSTHKLSSFRAHANHRHIVPDDGTAFVPDFRRGFVALKDGDSEAFGEEFIAAATSGEGVGETARNELLDEDLGEDLGGLTIEQPFDELVDFDPIPRRPG